MNYVVQPGDTLFKIAQRYGTTIAAIQAANPRITNPNKIYVGELIVLPVSAPATPAPVPNGGTKAQQPGVAGERPVSLVSATLSDGTNLQGNNNVPTNAAFVLTFDKNVVNNEVWQNNQSKITLTAPQNQNIPIVVTKISDKVDFSKRMNIYVQPTNPLNPNTSYTLNVLQGLKALNGQVLGETITINFKTTGS